MVFALEASNGTSHDPGRLEDSRSFVPDLSNRQPANTTVWCGEYECKGGGLEFRFQLRLEVWWEGEKGIIYTLSIRSCRAKGRFCCVCERNTSLLSNFHDACLAVPSLWRMTVVTNGHSPAIDLLISLTLSTTLIYNPLQYLHINLHTFPS